ncbi:MAG: phytoene desaturase family protein, partial [Acidimicrobiia bacterium]
VARVAVVGAGFSGLAAGCHLRGAGHDVVVCERETVPGGRAAVLERDGYRIDTGPVVLTMPGLLAEPFAAVGEELDDHLTLRRLDPMYRACFADGSELRVRPERDAMAEEIRALAGAADAAAFARFCRWLSELYEVEMPNFIARNYDSPVALARHPLALLRLARLGGLRHLAPKVASYFRDERLRRVFSFQALYAGLSPFDALALFGVITYMDTVAGVYFTDGGIHEAARALSTAAEKGGVELRLGEAVERIERDRDGTAAGVRLASGELVAADAVVCTADLPVAYRELLDLPPPRVARRGRYSPSCLLWLRGGSGDAPAGAAHHNIHFGAEWHESFDDLVGRGEQMRDPSLLVTMPTLTDPALAPGRRSTLYALEPVPNLDGRVDWHAESEPARDALIARVAGFGYPVEAEVEELIDPVEWERRGCERGTPFALAHSFFQSGPFRPSNRDRRIPGLVFAGSGTVPGVGVPMVLVSGRLAARRVEEWLEGR